LTRETQFSQKWDQKLTPNSEGAKNVPLISFPEDHLKTAYDKKEKSINKDYSNWDGID
jgi:hypothetical protein